MGRQGVSQLEFWAPLSPPPVYWKEGGKLSREEPYHLMNGMLFRPDALIRIHSTTPDIPMGKRLSPRASRSLALPIRAGTPRNAPMPAAAEILPAAPASVRALCCGSRPSRCGRRRLASRLPAASGETSSKPDLSPGSFPSASVRPRHRRPCCTPGCSDSSLRSQPTASTPRPRLRVTNRRG